MSEPSIEEIVARVERMQNNYPFPEDLIALIASWRDRGRLLMLMMAYDELRDHGIDDPADEIAALRGDGNVA